MAAMIKEERYIINIGNEAHVLHIEELLWGVAEWPEQFRAHIPPSEDRDANTVYGATAREVAERAMEYLSCFSSTSTWLTNSRVS